MTNLAVAVSRTKITEVRGTFQRHTGPHVTSVVGSPAGGRWGRPGAYPVLYLGRPTDAVVGEAYRHLVDDIEGMTGDTVGPRTLWTLQVAVTDVVDLRDPASLAAVGLTTGDLHSDTDKSAPRRPSSPACRPYPRGGELLLVAPSEVARELGLSRPTGRRPLTAGRARWTGHDTGSCRLVRAAEADRLTAAAPVDVGTPPALVIRLGPPELATRSWRPSFCWSADWRPGSGGTPYAEIGSPARTLPSTAIARPPSSLGPSSPRTRSTSPTRSRPRRQPTGPGTASPCTKTRMSPSPSPGGAGSTPPGGPERPGSAVSTLQPLPQPSTLERWVGEGGWLVDLLLPSTDAGVAGQALIVTVPFRPARRLAIVQLCAGIAVFTAGLRPARRALRVLTPSTGHDRTALSMEDP